MIGGSNKTVVTSFWLLKTVVASENLLQALWLASLSMRAEVILELSSKFFEDYLCKGCVSQFLFVIKFTTVGIVSNIFSQCLDLEWKLLKFCFLITLKK